MEEDEWRETLKYSFKNSIYANFIFNFFNNIATLCCPRCSFRFTFSAKDKFYRLTVILLLHPQHRGPFRMRIYERENFGGQMYELSDDCDNIMDCFHMSDCQSCNVMDGHWLMFEQPGFRGRMLYLRPGEYRNLREMGSNITKFSSIRRIMDSC